MDRLPDLLSERLRHGLPGQTAQRRFEPEGAEGRHFIPQVNCRRAAVAVLLYPHADAADQTEAQWYLPLTVRPDHLPDHPGQISLPGGALEPGEETFAAAVRELYEELGVEAAGLEPLGMLSELYVFVSNFLVTPWVLAARQPLTWQPSPDEVAEVLEVPLVHLADEANYQEHLRTIAGESRRVPHMAWGEHQIWGATSMILAELAELVREVTD